MVTNSKAKVQRLRTLFFKDPNKMVPVPRSSNLIGADDSYHLDIEMIIGELQPAIEGQVKQYLCGWTQSYRQEFNQFVGIIEKFSARLGQLEQDDITVDIIWRELELTLNSVLEWTERLSEEITCTNCEEDWQRKFSEILKTLPEFVELPVPADCWTIKTDDSLPQRLWKIRRRTEVRVKGGLFAVSNQFRRLLRINPLNSFPTHRKIQLHSFLSCYLGVPVADFLVAEWLQFLQQFAGQIYEVQTRVGEIFDEFLFLDNFETAILQFEPAKLGNMLENLQSHIQAITNHFQQLDHFEIEAGQRFQTCQVDLYQNISGLWYLASTYGLSNGSFAEKQVVNGWRCVEIQVSEAKNSWLDHFQGEQGGWQVGLELSLLQLETARICSRRLNDIEQKINRQIIPAFSGTQETITSFLERFAVIKKDNPAVFKDTISEQIRLILQSLQEESLPWLMDELIAAQLCSVTESGNADGIRNAIEALSDQHLILSHRDLFNPVPKSNIEVILILKKVVLESLLPKLELGYQEVSAENRQVIDKLIRGISEVDQDIEVNLKKASQQLARNQDTEIIEETCVAITAELNRTSLQLNELIAQAEQLLAVSQKKLLDGTKDFENRLRLLTSAEEIAEAYTRLAGKRVSGKIRIYRRKLFTNLKVAVPSLFSLLSSTLQQILSNYSRLREMTGLAPGKANAEENLSQFLIDTEKHISALPYVYQRLFRLEPLIDEQFFAAREKELDLLKTEFERWQMGRFSATAIIGERGCGITTLLNFAEKKIYRDYPVIKIDFLDGETIFTEEALFDFLKSIFKGTDLKSGLKNMEELENKINALDEDRIFIVENLHQLFLRTTYGFDALERFLLFISRTHQKIHWIMTCAIYSWEYLAKVINVDEYVQQRIVLDALPQAEFQNLILTRHRVSGYQLLFQPTEKIVASRSFKKLSSTQAQQTYLQNLFFKQLTDLAAGNITVAILLWLRSYAEFSQDKIIFPASINFDPTFLYQLSAEELFTLVAVLQHDILNAEHHARVFHQEIQHSLLLLNRMANKGFLVQKPNGYQIHPFLYRPVVRVLKSGNIIH